MRTPEQAAEVARTMKPLKVPGPTIDGGEPRENVYSHLFVGANTNHELVGASELHGKYAAQRLRAGGRNRRNVFLQFIGAGLLGVFLQGFTAEMLAAEPEPWVAVFYVVIGFMGIFGVFWSLIR